MSSSEKSVNSIRARFGWPFSKGTRRHRKDVPLTSSTTPCHSDKTWNDRLPASRLRIATPGESGDTIFCGFSVDGPSTFCERWVLGCAIDWSSAPTTCSAGDEKDHVISVCWDGSIRRPAAPGIAVGRVESVVIRFRESALQVVSRALASLPNCHRLRGRRRQRSADRPRTSSTGNGR